MSHTAASPKASPGAPVRAKEGAIGAILAEGEAAGGWRFPNKFKPGPKDFDSPRARVLYREWWDKRFHEHKAEL